MQKLTTYCLRHRWIVIAAWLVVLLAGIPNLARATNAFSQTFSVPGREGFETNTAVLKRYRVDTTADSLVPALALPAGKTVDSPGVHEQLAAAERTVERAAPGALVAGFGSSGDRAFVSHDGRTTFMVVLVPFVPNQGFDAGIAQERAVRAALKRSSPSWHVTGITALQHSGESGQNGGAGVLVEAFFGGLGALVVLAFVFASFVALIPLVMAIFAIVTTFMVMWLITAFAEVSFIVTFLVALIGLGVCIDYTLLIVVRWREERAKGKTNEQAVIDAMATAGESVLFSGTTVAVGLLSLVVLPVPFLRSVGYAGMLIPIVSVLAALTLLPVVLGSIGPRLDWPRIRKEDHLSGPWSRWGRFVVRRRWATAAVGLAAILALALAATQLQLGSGKADTISAHGDAHDGLVALERGDIGAAALTTFTVLFRDGARAPAAVTSLARVDGVRAAVAPKGWTKGGSRVALVLPQQDSNSSWGRSFFSRLKDAAHPLGGRVGGTPAQSADFVSAVYGSFPLMIALVSVLTFILLARAFRSLLLPAKAVVLNLLSVAAAWGVMVLVWQEGWGSHLIWGIAGTNAILEFIPLMVFAFLFGLSMDYEVFILARVREEYDAGGSTDGAVVEGIGRTGRLVTSAALILFLSFAALGSGPQTFLKIFATGLGAGIIIDATIVRSLIVPALVSLFGRWNWWLPGWAARILRVRESHAHEEPAGQPALDPA